jgi:hypothetical protein
VVQASASLEVGKANRAAEIVALLNNFAFSNFKTRIELAYERTTVNLRHNEVDTFRYGEIFVMAKMP